MTGRLLRTVLRHRPGADAPGSPDADLVRRFAIDRDEAAFAGLVARHGPMVWGVVRNLLGDEADAEDAFQATFLALVRGAGQVRNPAAVGAWLHGVAVRVATKAKRTAARRRRREEAAAVADGGREAAAAADWHELHAAVHDEVGRLPARERAVFVLCGLEGVRQPDAAAHLGLKVNTVSGLLARARKRLLERLAKRGLAPAAAAAAVGTAPAAAAPRSLTDGVLSLARAGDAAAGVSATVLELARGATEGGMSGKKLLAAAVILAAAIGTGTGALVLSSAGAQDTGSSDGGPPGAGTPGGGPPGRGAPGSGAPPGAPGTGAMPGGPPAGMPGMMMGMGGAPTSPAAASPARWEYKFADKPASSQTFAKLLTDNGNVGWEYCGVVEFAGGAGGGGGGPGLGGPGGGFPGGPGGLGGVGGGGAGFGDPGGGGEAKVVFKRPKAAAPAGGAVGPGGMGMGMMGVPGGGMPGGRGGMAGPGGDGRLGGTPPGMSTPGGLGGGLGSPDGGTGDPAGGGRAGGDTVITMEKVLKHLRVNDLPRQIRKQYEITKVDEKRNSVTITAYTIEKVQEAVDLLAQLDAAAGNAKPK